MKKLALFSLAILCVITLVQCSGGKEKTGIAALLPDSVDPGGWEATDTVQVFVGQNLYELINGGAEIYHEYGFKQVAACEYSNGEKSIMVEVFEMEDPRSAYGMYTFKTGKNGKGALIGDEAMLSDYYLNFRKGSYIVTLTGYDSDMATLQGLNALANDIADRIKGVPDVPTEILSMLPDEGLIDKSVVYIEGPLALQNIYHFGGDLFGVKAGVIGEYPDYYHVFLQYPDEATRDVWFQKARDGFRDTPLFKIFKQTRKTFTGIDNKDREITVTTLNNYLVIVIRK
ncbi:MAG: DUF6599 family protein [Candidatus Zixiibacteriota bacterium]